MTGPPISEDENEEGGEPPSENENEPGEQQPFEGPTMSRSVIASESKGKGITRGYDEKLQYKNEKSDGAWVPAVYHETIRLDLIHKASLKGEYSLYTLAPARVWPLLITKPEHERKSSFTPGDITSYLESHSTWGADRGGEYDSPDYSEGNWPPILYELRRPGNYSKSNYPEAEIWKYSGRVVLSVQDSRPLRKFENLPDTISTKISGLELETIMRLDPRVEARDIRGRMPMYYINETGKRVQAFTVATLAMRSHRFRAKEALLCWTERAGSNNTNELILNWLKEHEPRAFQEGNVRGIGPIPKELEEAILDANKTNPAVNNRAGLKYALDRPDQPRPKAAPAPTKRPRDNRSRSPHATRGMIRDREQPTGQLPAASRPPRGRPPTKDLPPTAAPQASEQQQQPPAYGQTRQGGAKMKNIRGQAPPQLHESEQQEQQAPAYGQTRQGQGAKMKNTRGQAPPPQRHEQQAPVEEPKKRKNTHGRVPSESPERPPPKKRPRTENTQKRREPARPPPEQSLAQPRRPLTRSDELPGPRRSERIPGVNPPMTIPPQQPEQGQKAGGGGNKTPPKGLPKKKRD